MPPSEPASEPEWINAANRLQGLYERGQLDAGLYRAGLQHFGLWPDGKAWRLFLGRAFGLGGLVTFLAGLIALMAWNWLTLSRGPKLAVAQAIFLGCSLLAAFGPQPWRGRLGGLGMALAGGALLALFGQIYQTGADSWELFRAWTLLNGALFALLRSNGLGLAASLTGALWLLTWSKPEGSYWSVLWEPIFDPLATLLLVAWALAELFRRWGLASPKPSEAAFFPRFDPSPWLTQVLGALTLSLVTIKFVAFLLQDYFDWGDYWPNAWKSPNIVWAYWPILAGVGYYYGRARPNFFFLTAGIFSLGVAVGAKFLLWLPGNTSDEVGICLAGLGSLALILGVTKLLLVLRQAQRPVSSPEPEAMAEPAIFSAPKITETQNSLAINPLVPGKAWREWLTGPAGFAADTALELSADQAQAELRALPWYLKTFIFLGVWVAVAFLGLFIFSLVGPRPEIILLIGIIFCFIGVRNIENEKFSIKQISLSLILFGLVSGLFIIFMVDGNITYVLFFYFILFSSFSLIMRKIWHKAINFALAILFLFILFFNNTIPILIHIYSVFYAILALLTYIAVLNLTDWPPQTNPPDPSDPHPTGRPLRNPWGGVSEGAALFLALSALASVTNLGSWSYRFLGWLHYAEAGISLGFLAFAVKSLTQPQTRRTLAPLAGVLAWLSWLFAPLGPGAALTLLARARGKPGLLGLAAAYLGAGLTMFHYQMRLTFPQKGLALTLSGLLLLGAALACRKLGAPTTSPKPGGTQKPLPGPRPARAWAILGLGLAALIALNSGVFANELILSQGRIVLLKIAPVDPLSLFQGYYVRVNLAVDRDLNQALQRLPRLPRQGLAVLADEAGLGSFRRVHAGEPLAAGEYLVSFRVRPDGQARVSGGSFFFQEGARAEYERAKCAEARVSAAGQVLLTQLRDLDRQLIEPKGPAFPKGRIRD
ncbi:MAG: GDYXXLXY domain-containing protein [Deltaproteobacteria bacterium]|jgi:uncharacterized membrane-anchored protein|nr:GDYXXLXY domain-containing protein [Deltaproteobacteria bacterium]